MPILLIPRRADLSEHCNDHLQATVGTLAGCPGILVAQDETELATRNAEDLALRD